MRQHCSFHKKAHTACPPASRPKTSSTTPTRCYIHSPGYRSRYAGFLKIDFPRLPLTGNLELFRALARLGGELTSLHLLESPRLEQPITEFAGGGNPEVEKVSWSNDTVWINKAKTIGFRSVRELVWNFHIGGYQVCQKWLKDRKRRTLSADDIAIEVKRAMERHEARQARVIPIILRPCDWHGAPFGKLLAAPLDGKPITKWPDRDEAFLDVVKQIRAALPKTAGRSRPDAAHQSAPHLVSTLRSSNLRLRKQFSEADQDRFLDEAFEFMARYFEGSLAELQQRNPDIETRFKRIDAQTFTAVIYRQGKSEARCAIHYGGNSGFGGGITFSRDESSRGNSFNEAVSVEVGEQSLSLKAMGMHPFGFGGQSDSHLSPEGAAEYYWAMLIEPLQR
ncbi:MAG: type ISP restriction/modification enzyme [Opitutaceae bacterium]